MKASWHSTKSSMFKSWPRESSGATIRETVCTRAYIRKKIKNLLLKNHWTRKTEFYMKAFWHITKSNLLELWSTGSVGATIGETVFSSTELKAQVSYSDRRLSVVCFAVRLPVNFYIFDFFSRTTGPILTRLGTNHPWVEGFKFIQMKRNALLQGEIIAKE
jgi:hypothetical protein